MDKQTRARGKRLRHLGLGLHLLPGQGFHWYGRTRQGVGRWEGDPRTLLWSDRLFLVLAIAFALGAVRMLGLPTESEGASALLAVSGLTLLVRAWVRHLRRQVLALTSLEEATGRLDVTTDDLQRRADRRGIRPRMVLNDQPLYAPEDLEGAGLLLRPAQAPETAQLLRPAEGETGKEERLLRPAGDPAPADQSETAPNKLHGA